MDKMEGYRVGPWDWRILRAYWDRLHMVAHAGDYYGAEFQGFWGVTQGDPLSPTILNVVMEAVVRRRISLVAGGARWQGRWGREVLH